MAGTVSFIIIWSFRRIYGRVEDGGRPLEGTMRVLSRPNPADDETLVYRTCGQRKRVDVAACEGVCIGGGGGKRLTRMSTDLFLLPAKASWESKRSNRHPGSYETRLRNEISSGEEEG